MKELRQALGALRQNVLGPLAAVAVIMLGHWLRYGELTRLDIATALVTFVIAMAAVLAWKSHARRQRKAGRNAAD